MVVEICRVQLCLNHNKIIKSIYQAKINFQNKSYSWDPLIPMMRAHKFNRKFYIGTLIIYGSDLVYLFGLYREHSSKDKILEGCYE